MIQIEENIPLAGYTTFKIGGSARFFIEVDTDDALRDALGWAREKNIRAVLLAGGSNVLVPDKGLDALVIRMTCARFSFADSVVKATAGCELLQIIRDAASLGLGGWEKLSGIPGSLGGAIRGNAGAFGKEIKDVTMWVQAFNTKTEEIQEFSNAECAFEYRNSFFKQHPEWIVIQAHLKLTAVDPVSSEKLIKETIAERDRRHLQDVQAAGSFFMNPVAPIGIRQRFEAEKNMSARGGRVPAGWLIEKAGLKGASIGGAQASPQHPNYIVNTGNATAKEVLELAERIKAEVKRQFGVHLVEEAVVL